jgi:hypothetical protein
MNDPSILSQDGHAQEWPPGCEFLIVDGFLDSFVHVRVLKTAFELGLIDRLVMHGSGSAVALGQMVGLDGQGLHFLLGLLAEAGVVEERRGDIRLTGRFRAALRYRDLLETKLDYAGFAIGDFAKLFTSLVRGGGDFMREARLFELFDYQRCFTPTIENYARTRLWMRVTSTLTRYEASACLAVHDIGQYRRMLDVGGNSGELALQFCQRNTELQGSIFDLPLVCELGLDHVLPHAEHRRICFVKGDIRSDAVPGGHDLITFKSMLHDWPAEDACGFIDKAARALEPGGTLLIFERAKLRASAKATAMSMVPNLLFFRSYRDPSVYTDRLRALGFLDIKRTDIELDSTFFVVTARKPGI